MLQGKVAIITGGSRGIGNAIARKFLDNGASLFLVALHEDKLLEARDEMKQISAKVEALHGDIADPLFARQIMEKTLEVFGTIDILVNCAGTLTRTPFEELENEEWHRVIDVNLNGTFYLCKQVLPVMKQKNHGKIINITSQMARLPHPNASPSYEASKAGIAALTRHMAYHYAQHNICVNSIAPGSINTELPNSMSDEARAWLKSAIPMGRLGTPQEVSDLALFLASDMSSYITGTTININGGSLMD